MKQAKLYMAAAVIAFSGSAWAGHNGASTDYARVVSASPIYEQVAHSTPHQQCWTEQVRYEQPYRRHNNSATGTILGTMIGAAVGHNVAQSKKGQKVGRIAGAILGASIANDMSHRPSRSHRVNYRNERRCETRHVTEYQQALVGYDVTYRYHGRTYQTRMDHHPGERLPVKVEVIPVY